MFKEQERFHELNRQTARDVSTRQATLADGSIGIVLDWDSFPIVLTNNEAIRVATKLANAVERNRT